MLRNDFIKKVAERTGESQVDVRNILEGIEDETIHLVEIEDYAPFSFGRVGGKTKEARVARNPKTGEQLSVSPHYVAAFRSGQDLKKALWNLPVKMD